jgi:hypothetical protein
MENMLEGFTSLAFAILFLGILLGACIAFALIRLAGA